MRREREEDEVFRSFDESTISSLIKIKEINERQARSKKHKNPEGVWMFLAHYKLTSEINLAHIMNNKLAHIMKNLDTMKARPLWRSEDIYVDLIIRLRTYYWWYLCERFLSLDLGDICIYDWRIFGRCKPIWSCICICMKNKSWIWMRITKW